MYPPRSFTLKGCASMLGFCLKQKSKMRRDSRACAVPQGLRMRSEACGKWNGPVGTSRGELSEPFLKTPFRNKTKKTATLLFNCLVKGGAPF
jgi:hypothetical protein